MGSLVSDRIFPGVNVSDLINDVPSDLEEEMVKEKTEDYDYVKKDED